MKKNSQKRSVLLKVVLPIAAATLFAVVFLLVYMQGWPNLAKRPNDPIGYWIETLGIPAVWMATYVLAFVLDRRGDTSTTDPCPPGR